MKAYSPAALLVSSLLVVLPTSGALAAQPEAQQAEPGFSFDTKDLRLELAPMSGSVLPDLVLENKTEAPLTVDLCHAVFIGWQGELHKLAPCALTTIAPGETLHQRLWVENLTGDLPDLSGGSGARRVAHLDDSAYSMVLPLHVRGGPSLYIQAKFRLQTNRPVQVATKR